MNLDTMASVLLEKLKGIAQTDTVVGQPIVADGVTLIPVSRVSVGFGLGGVGGKGEAAGSGGGLTVEPIAFPVDVFSLNIPNTSASAVSMGSMLMPSNMSFTAEWNLSNCTDSESI